MFVEPQLYMLKPSTHTQEIVLKDEAFGRDLGSDEVIHESGTFMIGLVPL